MYSRVRNFFSYKLNLLLIFCAVFFISSTVYLYRRALILMDTAGSNQAKLHELALAKTGAKSIETLFDLTGNSLQLIANNQNVIKFDPDSQKILDNFFLGFQQTPVSSLFITDASGIIRLTANTTKSQSIVGTSIASTTYYTWATNAVLNSMYVDKPTFKIVGTDKNKGNNVISLVTPIVNQGEFQGVVVAEILLSELSRQYFDPLKVSESTHIFILNTQGIFLYATYPDWIGLSLIDYINKTPFEGSTQLKDFITSSLDQLQEGTTETIWPQFQSGMPTLYVVTYAPIQFVNQKFLLLLTTPKVEIWQTFTQVYQNQIALLVLLLMIVAFFSAILLLGIRLAQREAFQKGFVMGREHAPKK